MRPALYLSGPRSPCTTARRPWSDDRCRATLVAWHRSPAPRPGPHLLTFFVATLYLSYMENRPMPSLHISLPDSLKEFVKEEVDEGGYGTPSDYVRSLLREAKERKVR